MSKQSGDADGPRWHQPTGDIRQRGTTEPSGADICTPEFCCAIANEYPSTGKFRNYVMESSYSVVWFAVALVPQLTGSTRSAIGVEREAVWACADATSVYRRRHQLFTGTAHRQVVTVHSYKQYFIQTSYARLFLLELLDKLRHCKQTLSHSRRVFVLSPARRL